MEHRRIGGCICEATAGAPFENRPHESPSVSDALRTVREWALPLQPAERHLLVTEFEGVQFMGDGNPIFFFARVSRLETMMRAVRIEKSESEIVQIILRQLPERYDVVKTMTLADPQLTRSGLENNIRSSYSQRKAHEIAKQEPAAGTSAAPPNPHALVVGRGFGDGGGAGEAEANEGTTVWYFVAVARRGSNSSNGLAAVVFLISINVALMLSLRPGRRGSSNRHGEFLRSELTGSTTAGATPYTSRRTHLPRQAHRCVRCTAVAVAANMGTIPNTVLHRVGLRAIAEPAVSMVTYGGAALSVAVGNLI